jgi:hypothetical protein
LELSLWVDMFQDPPEDSILKPILFKLESRIASGLRFFFRCDIVRDLSLSSSTRSPANADLEKGLSNTIPIRRLDTVFE